LRSHQRDALAFVNEAVDQEPPWQDAFIPCEAALLIEEVERGQT
jgi:hypothetical protein